MKAIATGMILAALVMAIISVTATPVEAKGKSQKSDKAKGYIVHGADHATGDECAVYFAPKKGANTFQAKYYPDAKVEKATKSLKAKIDSEQIADCAVVENGGRVDVSAAPQSQVNKLISLGYHSSPFDGGEYLYPPASSLDPDDDVPATGDPFAGKHCADVVKDPTDGNCAAFEQAAGHP